MRLSLLAAVAAVVTLSGATVATAQNSAVASVTAEVQQPITVTKTRDLEFGTVFPGVDKVIAVTSGSCAAFSIAGQASAEVHITFTLPTTLSSGANTLVIDNWAARHNTTNSSASGTDFTPSASPTTATLSGTGELYVFVGATAQPTIDQTAGTYSGTATMTVVYF